ncbi:MULTISPECIES: response regulator [unclassified Shinella]|jgi:DNA-binding NarL/FixJ family response regulator|uniref:response regulator n=1 Tax=unclassified Shinella TaxID=2643062 RepID=UPI0003C560AD|nr:MULTISPECIES: response regulator transcription factor [unclassified Shinella]EYR83152.1 glycerol metabolism activator [Shinella sp. DD12]KNY18617.1 LuxR family transcriptional regulator [Shinella sp. SUS2]KOC76465.1 LuxR family transcriptional regulator [Shinella sp. GWS1]MCO5153446.1 response regulator transcription factor [Shinella sp.]MDC7260625.1 response regulator transcription factor [Shinella sp. HY16]
MASALTIIIADDHPLFRGALKQALTGMAGNPDIVEAGDFEAARKAAAGNPNADLMLLDLAMPGVSGLSGLISLRAEFQSLPVVIVSASDDPATIRRALDLGASGFISKSASIEDIREGIGSVLEGNIYTPGGYVRGPEQDSEVADLIARLRTLTPQQSRVLAMLAEGLLNKQIAYELSVSEATIKAHVSAILLKLNVDSRTQAVIQLGKIGSAQAAA